MLMTTVAASALAPAATSSWCSCCSPSPSCWSPTWTWVWRHRATFPPDVLTLRRRSARLSGGLHLLLRWKASYADPLLLPIATLLNGLGLVMIHRLDLAHHRPWPPGWRSPADLERPRDRPGRCRHRSACATTASCAATPSPRWRRAWDCCCCPSLPVLGRNVNGSRIWIGIGPLSFQPGEVAKIVLAIFFAGYLVQTRDVLSLVGRRFLGMTLPRARDLGPIIVAWLASLSVLVFENDLGSSLLFFGLFVAMLYVATERNSWIAIGLTLFCVGAYAAYLAFAHVQQRVLLWLHPFAQKALETSDQLVKGLKGMASGGLMGTGLGRGHPELTYFAESRLHRAQLRRGARPGRPLRVARPVCADGRAGAAHRSRRP